MVTGVTVNCGTGMLAWSNAHQRQESLVEYEGGLVSYENICFE